MKKHERIDPARAGGYFDDFLKEEGMFEDANAHAVKQVVSWQIAEEMKRQGLTKVEMAKRMGTSRSSLNRLLDPENDALALSTLMRAAMILGKELQVSLV
jgi:predicted XRE-type DNA-binding protein